METSNRELTVGKGRFESLSDGIFAVAITLLILEVHLPANVGPNTPLPQQFHALVAIWPQYLVYIATFATIAIMWLNHHALLDRAHRITHSIIIANFCLLALICFLPFTIYVLEVLGLTPPAVVLYGITNFAIGCSYFFLQRAVLRAHGKPPAPFTRWSIGLFAYPIATIVAFFLPLVSIFIIAFVGFVYAMPGSIELSRRSLDE